MLVLDKMLKFISNKLIYFSITWFVLLLSLYLYFIDKSFYFSDESFYLINLLPDIYKLEVTQWAKIYTYFYFDNLIYDKLFITLIQFISVSFFSYTSTKLLFNNKKYFWSIVLATIASMYLLVGPNRMTVPNYITLNLIATLFGVAFLFLYFRKKNIWSLFLSGVFIGVLPFLMITTIPTFLFFLLAIWFYDKKYKPLVVFSVGIFSFCCFYFSVIQSPFDFLIKFKEAIKFMQNDNSHGVLSIIIWIVKIFVSKSALGFIFIFYYFLNKKFNFNKWFTVVVGVLFLIWFSVIIFDFIFAAGYISNTGLYYLFAIALLIEQFKSIELRKKVLIVFLLLLPFFAMLGTNVSFLIRSTVYLPLIFISIVYLVYLSKSKMVTFSLVIILTISTIAYFLSPFKHTWEQFIGVQQTEKFVSSKGVVYLDSERLGLLNEVKSYIKNEVNVIVSHPRLHGLLYLNNAKPPFHYYMPDKATEHFLIDNKYDYKTYIFLESKEFPFKEAFLKNVTYNKINTFSKVETEHFYIYSLKPLVKE